MRDGSMLTLLGELESYLQLVKPCSESWEERNGNSPHPDWLQNYHTIGKKDWTMARLGEKMHQWNFRM
jgi:hypothetical protein